MSRKVVLVGHCGPDSSHLRLAIMRAGKDVQVLSAEDQSTLDQLVKEGVDLVLFNRELGWGFADKMGVDAIRRMRQNNPAQKTMLVSNYPDAQAAAEAAGALPGFGKRELGSPRVAQVLGSVLAGPASAGGGA